MSSRSATEESSPASSSILSKPKLSRASNPKVRTGCITCKKRRVKCDECRPYCKNCLKKTGFCEGYVEPRPRKSRPPPPEPPQVTWNSKEIFSTIVTTRPHPGLPLGGPQLSSHETNQLYFEEFVNLVQRPWLNATSQHDLWKITIPQLAQVSNTLREAAMAIGAMCVWNRQTQRGTRCPKRSSSIQASDPEEDRMHYVRALSHYSKSLKWQRETPSALDAVFLSILLLAFETLRGGRAAALDHVNHGLALLLTIIADDGQKQVDLFAPNPRPILNIVADIYSRLSIQARFIVGGRIGVSRPLPHFTQGLKARQLTYDSFFLLVDQLSPSRVDLDDMPAAFSTLDEFEAYLTAVQQSGRHSNSVIVDSFQSFYTTLPPASDCTANEIWDMAFNDARNIEVCKNNLAMSKQLDDAFVPLFNNIVTSDVDPKTYLRALHLRLQCFGARVFDDPLMFGDFERIHEQTLICKEYLSLAEIAVRAARRQAESIAHQLFLHNDVAWRLTIVSMFCRDPLTREQALWMLREYPGHNGLWNVRSLYALASRNRVVEDANVCEGTPEEQWWRLARREYAFEKGGDKIIFRYMEKDLFTGEWALVEDAAEVGGDTDDIRWMRQGLSVEGKLLMSALISP